MIIEPMKNYNREWAEHNDAFTDLLNRPEKYINRVFDVSIINNCPYDPLWYISVLKSVYENGKQKYALITITDNHLDNILDHVKIIDLCDVRAFGLHDWSIEGFIRPDSILFESFLRLEIYKDLENRTHNTNGIVSTSVTIDKIPRVLRFINNFEVEIM